ncbi:hypothetical protein ACFY2R_26455 [Micromonospora olivasterospora]|uniref:Uncharacterized protein n=1 Tax=Micromonospora olivasterospora TaxID=1880 RepID=A0A562HU81_MICOL|nr:hypothetical protein [Micromonospora olivasterospora]TWH62326.1 hypothetical protein JD77_06377 [Micromonospora olivasterospora]
MPTSADETPLLGRLDTPAPTPEQVHEHQVVRDLITQALAAQSARRHQLEQAGEAPRLLDHVIATQHRLAQALQTLDPADEQQVARLRQECIDLLREAGR